MVVMSFKLMLVWTKMVILLSVFYSMTFERKKARSPFRDTWLLGYRTGSWRHF